MKRISQYKKLFGIEKEIDLKVQKHVTVIW